MPSALNPPCPPIIAIAPAFCSAFRKSPNCAKISQKLFLGAPSGFIITIFPRKRDVSFSSSSRLKKLAVTTSPSAPPAGVDPVHPIASTVNVCRTGEINSASAVPRVQPFHIVHFSARTFCRPIAFILPTPQSTAFCAAGVPVTRPPISSLNSVRYSKACESIVPSPAIFTSAALVPSSYAPLGATSVFAFAQKLAASSPTPAINHRFLISTLASVFYQPPAQSFDSTMFLDAAQARRVCSKKLFARDPQTTKMLLGIDGDQCCVVGPFQNQRRRR